MRGNFRRNNRFNELNGLLALRLNVIAQLFRRLKDRRIRIHFKQRSGTFLRGFLKQTFHSHSVFLPELLVDRTIRFIPNRLHFRRDLLLCLRDRLVQSLLDLCKLFRSFRVIRFRGGVFLFRRRHFRPFGNRHLFRSSDVGNIPLRCGILIQFPVQGKQTAVSPPDSGTTVQHIRKEITCLLVLSRLLKREKEIFRRHIFR